VTDEVPDTETPSTTIVPVHEQAEAPHPPDRHDGGVPEPPSANSRTIELIANAQIKKTLNNNNLKFFIITTINETMD